MPDRIEYVDTIMIHALTVTVYRGNPWAAPVREQTMADRKSERRICNQKEDMTYALSWFYS